MRCATAAALFALANCVEASLHRGRAPTAGVQLPPSETKYWNDLAPNEQAAARTLGYDRQLWDNNGLPKSDDKRWNTLTAKEQQAANTLGYGKQLWNQELDSRGKLPAGGQKVQDLVDDADAIMKAIDKHATAASAAPGGPSSQQVSPDGQHQDPIAQDPSSPEAHDARMQAEIESHSQDPSSPQAHDAKMEKQMHSEADDSPEAHDARMQAEIDSHNNVKSKRGMQQETIEAMRKVAAAAAPPQAGGMHPKVNAIWEQAQQLFASVPETSASFSRARAVFRQIKDAVQNSIKKQQTTAAKPTTDQRLDNWIAGQSSNDGIPNHYQPHGTLDGGPSHLGPEIKPPNGVAIPMEKVEEAPAKTASAERPDEASAKATAARHSAPNVPQSEVEHSRAALEHAAAKATAARHSAPNIPQSEVEHSRTALENAAASIQSGNQVLVRKISQFEDDRKGMIAGNKAVLSKINGFFVDQSKMAAAIWKPNEVALHPDAKIRAAYEDRVVAKTDAKVAAHEQAEMNNPNVPHTPGDDTMNQGEQHPASTP